MNSVRPSLFSSAQMVDLFAGPGGLDVAAHWLGLKVAGVEWDRDACTTRNAAHLVTEFADVREFAPTSFPDATVLTGGPPCQTYTVAGGGAGRRALDQVLEFLQRMVNGEDVMDKLANMHGDADPRTGLVLEPLRWVLAAHRGGKPYEAIVLEQVPAVLPVWEEYEKALRNLGYDVDTGILHTEEFGVPQTRRRAILIARLNGEAKLPTPTHRRYRKGKSKDEGDQKLLPWVSMAEALSRKDKFVVVSNYGTGGVPEARGRRRSDEPSATVTGKIDRNKLYPDDTLTATPTRFEKDEYGRLQTFPKNYPWSGRHIPQQVGNAIPPRLATHILAAALGLKFEADDLDRAVRSNWDPYPAKPLVPTTKA
ncbi:DNA (cytosine-5)-methyltransferase 1 [Lentzea albidocapillata subsp. violacea]|uniref:DNA (cytosine-5-)-methyltransferase n=1 Tax=Lentzea albidocapillata subsp. violacea TaxID=128104 RepID=A0A1G8XJ95_9PSEU|nr:DNA cytosine methyltransferase [Lentzea albidocapillata]SDJ89830.1 DNA (cytosine-5)-methyltransferase 1 [Lentzea albidocapillata subsp. violacea]